MTLAAVKKTGGQIGRDGQPYEMEPMPRHIVRAKYDLKAQRRDPGHDDAISEETRRRKHTSRFEQYAYRRLSKGQITAFEWFRRLCEIVACGTLSHSRYGNEAGSIDCAVYGEREVSLRVREAARNRRRCVVRIQRRASHDALRAVLWAASEDLTPREIGDRLWNKLSKAEQGVLDNEAKLHEKAAVGLAIFHLRAAINEIDEVFQGRC